MSIDELIARLGNAGEDERFLELQIAQAIGYRREVTGNPDGTRSVLWFLPSGDRAFASQIPKFTSSVDDAKALLDMVSPGHVAAIAVDAHGARAVVEGDDPSFGRTAAVALSIAALKRLRSR